MIFADIFLSKVDEYVQRLFPFPGCEEKGFLQSRKRKNENNEKLARILYYHDLLFWFLLQGTDILIHIRIYAHS